LDHKAVALVINMLKGPKANWAKFKRIFTKTVWSVCGVTNYCY